MKEVHLLCNAHLDPVWLWQKHEGMAEALSTFRVAADFCEQFDGFVFNHNESLLYEWVEECEPELFERIRKLVEAGKWRIMGGWYLQPDCLMPSGESFVRQMEVGNRYFLEKFGVKTTTAVNLDPFGHSRGLVQILKKAGYESYLFQRPSKYVPEQDFIWKGYDGSRLYGHNLGQGYGSHKGQAVAKLEGSLPRMEEGANLLLWGIGDHGGGPSRQDLEMIEAFRNAHPEVKILHSWCENYFDAVDKTRLRTIDTSLVHCMVGCYTSMVRIKQNHRMLENELAVCERMLAASGMEYDRAELDKAEKALLFCEFHDILPGSMVQKAEEESLMTLHYARDVVAEWRNKAFFRLCAGQKPGKSGEIPVLVYNPHPWPVTETIEVEFILEDQNWNESEFTVARVRDAGGQYLPTQHEQTESNLNLDWCKHVVFTAELKPMCINRFDCELTVIDRSQLPPKISDRTETHFIFKNPEMTVHINRHTGLLDVYRVHGVDYLNEKGVRLEAYRDNEDPWGMNVDEFADLAGEFELMSDAECNAFNGYPGEILENVRVIEAGSVRTKVQATFQYGATIAVVTYTIPRQGTDVDIHIRMLSNRVHTMYRLTVDTTLNDSRFVGQSAFGREEMRQGHKEVTYQKWCALMQGERGLAVLNRGTYGGSADSGTLHISLLRTPVYAAHPLFERQITPHDRFNKHIDMGEREFEYRLTTHMDRLDYAAEIYNQIPYALSFFPSGAGETTGMTVELDNPTVLLSALKKLPDGRMLVRLFNTKETENTVQLKLDGQIFRMNMTPFEVRTCTYDGTQLNECAITGIEEI